ncbi:MAG: prolipoprotein diacylglyceryl transferase [Thermoleophilaceae bacterium]
MLRLAVIRVGIDPTFELGPLTLAWHGITIAVGILVGALVAARMARERGLDPEPITTFAVIAALAGVAGARLFYLLETGAITDPSAWVGRLGFTFSGGLVLAGLVIAAYVRRRSLSAVYLDAAAVGLALGLAIGRIGDVINGEHYGPASDFFLAVQNSHPEASVPDPGVAYHSGGLYEVLLAAAIFAVVWPLRHRLDRPTALVWIVLGLYGAGRFIESFLRLDSPEVALGLTTAHASSLALMLAAGAGVLWARRRLWGR